MSTCFMFAAAGNWGRVGAQGDGLLWSTNSGETWAAVIRRGAIWRSADTGQSWGKLDGRLGSIWPNATLAKGAP